METAGELCRGQTEIPLPGEAHVCASNGTTCLSLGGLGPLSGVRSPMEGSFASRITFNHTEGSSSLVFCEQVVCSSDGSAELQCGEAGVSEEAVVTHPSLEVARICSVPQLSWEADRAWSLRMLSLLLQCARLQMLMAWCSTLGGAHSSLGEQFTTHAATAGVISQRQLVLATEMGDPMLACRCKLYCAFSLLQRGRGRQACRIIREQYKYATEEAVIKDPKLITMCLAAWIKLKHLMSERKRTRETADALDIVIQEVS